MKRKGAVQMAATWQRSVRRTWKEEGNGKEGKRGRGEKEKRGRGEEGEEVAHRKATSKRDAANEVRRRG